MRRTNDTLFDHLVAADEQAWGHGEIDRSRGFEVDDGHSALQQTGHPGNVGSNIVAAIDRMIGARLPAFVLIACAAARAERSALNTRYDRPMMDIRFILPAARRLRYCRKCKSCRSIRRKI
jgi:hypothetical protein